MRDLPSPHYSSSFQELISVSLSLTCRTGPPVSPSGQERAPVGHGNDPRCPWARGVGTASEQQGRREGGEPECDAGPGPLTDHSGGGRGGAKDQQVGSLSPGSLQPLLRTFDITGLSVVGTQRISLEPQSSCLLMRCSG